jgi:hypothetical protein
MNPTPEDSQPHWQHAASPPGSSLSLWLIASDSHQSDLLCIAVSPKWPILSRKPHSVVYQKTDYPFVEFFVFLCFLGDYC